MSAAAVLHLPKPMEHQQVVLNDPSPKKAWRGGRRSGKSVGGRLAGTRGHGPKVNGKRTLRGMLDGGNIAWITKTYKQSKVVWRKLLRMFRDLEGVLVEIDRDDRRISMLSGKGALTVWTGHTRDALDNVRGDGLDGALLDEAAYFDAEYAIGDVLRSALLDNGGWIFLFSTPNAGWDKNEKRAVPSYFNRLCQEIIDGVRRGWSHFHNRSDDNPRLSREGLADMRAEYPPDSPTIQQEIDALLVAGGLLALTIDRDEVLVKRRAIPSHWTLFGAIDWGYSHPWVFGLFGVNESGTVTLIDSVSGRKQSPKDIHTAVKQLLVPYSVQLSRLSYTVAGGDVFDEHGKSRGLSGETIAQQWAGLGWSVIRSQASGPNKRVVSLNNMRSYFADGRLKVADTPGNLRVLRVLESRISDPANPEDVLKVDADANGVGGDDEYDMARYGLFSRPITAKLPPTRRDPESSEPWKELAKKAGVRVEKHTGRVVMPRVKRRRFVEVTD